MSASAPEAGQLLTLLLALSKWVTLLTLLKAALLLQEVESVLGRLCLNCHVAGQHCICWPHPAGCLLYVHAATAGFWLPAVPGV